METSKRKLEGFVLHLIKLFNLFFLENNKYQKLQKNPKKQNLKLENKKQNICQGLNYNCKFSLNFAFRNVEKMDDLISSIVAEGDQIPEFWNHLDNFLNRIPSDKATSRLSQVSYTYVCND